jgi:F-type H+-transporting ATPase subunit b
MMIDATFWVAVSFFAFMALLIYFKIPQKVTNVLIESINNIKNEVEDAEKLKEEANNILSDYEKKISTSKDEIKEMIDNANDDAEKIILKTNKEFHLQMENRKRNTEDRIKQMKNEALKDIKNASVKIAVQSVVMLLRNSLDKSKLNKLYLSSIEETKLALRKKSS